MTIQLSFLGRPAALGGNEVLAYCVDGDDVYFTALTIRGQSSINGAERIILAISRALNRPWIELQFHDLQTWRGYEGKRQGWWTCDRLRVLNRSGQPHVDGWREIARWRYPSMCDREVGDAFPANAEQLAESFAPELAKLPGLPAHVMALFQPIIDGQEIRLAEPA